MLHIEKLIDWFLFSPIYEDGAYRVYYSKSEKGPFYPEITAYAISLCCTLYKREDRELFLNRAEKCAKYLIGASISGGIPCHADSLLYTFDTGIFVSSMFDLFDLTGRYKYVKEAEESIEWMCSQRVSGRIAASNSPPTVNKWYRYPSVHLAKLAIPLMKASIYLENEKYEKIAFELLNWHKRMQSPDGRFILNENTNEVLTHPHCYATEGFLYAYNYSGKQEFLETVKKSANWLAANQNNDGSFYGKYEESYEKRIRWCGRKRKVTDATAQATRLWKILGINRNGIEKAYQFLYGESRDGGLKLAKNCSLIGNIFSGQRTKLYSWPTFFLIHSLILPYGKIEHASEIF